MLFDIYTLPYLVINAGQESSFQFGIFNDDGQAVQNATYQCDVVEYCNEGSPIATWSGQVEYDSASLASTIGLTFAAAKTAALAGKYIYQISIKLQGGTIGEIRKGIVFVRSNISKQT